MYIRKKLDCGIDVICEKVENFKSCTIGVWVKAGSITETNEENGISHLIEHMLFKGTEKRTAKQIAIDVDNLGGQINAFTSKECTCYYIKVTDEKIDEGIEVLADLFINASIPKEELEKERYVVLEEIAMYNDTPDEVVHEIVSSAFYTGTPLEKTILGPAKNVENFTREDIMAYRQKYYSAKNILIAVAGNFDENELFDSLNKYFCTHKLSDAEKSVVDYKESEKISREVSAYKDIEQAHICWAYPGFDLLDDKRYALSVLNNIVGGSMSSRLFQSIREERGMAYSVYSYPSVYLHSGMFCVYAGTMLKNADEVLKLMDAEIKKLISDKITKEEFEQSKQQLKGNYILALESTSARMNSIGKAQLLAGRVREDDEIIKQIEDIKFDEVADIIPYIFDETKCTKGIVGKIK